VIGERSRAVCVPSSRMLPVDSRARQDREFLESFEREADVEHHRTSTTRCSAINGLPYLAHQSPSTARHTHRGAGRSASSAECKQAPRGGSSACAADGRSGQRQTLFAVTLAPLRAATAVTSPPRAIAHRACGPRVPTWPSTPIRSRNAAATAACKRAGSAAERHRDAACTLGHESVLGDSHQTASRKKPLIGRGASFPSTETRSSPKRLVPMSCASLVRAQVTDTGFRLLMLELQIACRSTSSRGPSDVSKEKMPRPTWYDGD